MSHLSIKVSNDIDLDLTDIRDIVDCTNKDIICDALAIYIAAVQNVRKDGHLIIQGKDGDYSLSTPMLKKILERK